MLARRFPVLAHRDFRLLLADRLLAPGAFAFSMVGVSFAVLDATGSTADLSYVLAAQILPALVFALVGGVFADRFAPQRVIVAANLMIAVGEGGFGLLVLLGQPRLWQMIGLETLTGAGMAIFYPASQALLPRLVPDSQLQEASAMSRLAMNAAQMAGAGIAGVFVAATGPAWALTPWRTAHGPRRWGGLMGGSCAITPLGLGARGPLPGSCVSAGGLGIAGEFMMVQWTVTMARNVPPDLLARVSAYDVIGSVGAMPLGA